ncbi:hypothetical protein JKF63_05935 [Porcisia hertigi]|uniref:Uncharacterized protein n=1 Tax=Porcisia hertigi TaxID=2761500 RepID=A0A836IIS8_9TRYP|nr:hypothetical protein JKF63_05935 [Porcisia hertigi]
MTRLREQVKSHREGVKFLQCASGGTASTSARGAGAAAQALPKVTTQGQGGHEKLHPCSYRPARRTPAEVTPYAGNGVVADALAMPEAHSVGADKVLPNGLWSPRAITDFAAALLDSPGFSNAKRNLVKNVNPAPVHQRQQQKQQRQQPNSLSQTPKQLPKDLTGGGAGGVRQTNVPFHALRLVSGPPADSPDASSVLSSPSEGDGDASGLSAMEEKREPQGVVREGVESALTARVLTGSHPSIASPAAMNDETPPPFGCPFALMGDCTQGAHTNADLCEGPTLHPHLITLTKSVQRMQKRQHELERLVLRLHQQVSLQAVALHEANEEIQRALQGTRISPGVRRCQQESFADSSFELALTSASGRRVRTWRKSSKALPRDVSMQELLVTDYGMCDEGGAGAGREAGEKYAGDATLSHRARSPYGAPPKRDMIPRARGGDGGRTGAKLRARQLRRCTSAGQQHLDMADARANTSPLLTPVRPERRRLVGSETATAALEPPKAGIQGRSERMLHAHAARQQLRQQRQGGTNHCERGLGGSLKQSNPQYSGSEGVPNASGDIQAEGGTGDARGERYTTVLLSVPRPSGAHSGTDGSTAPAGPEVFTASSHLHYSNYSRHQPGAGCSTEVSGMSNVPPYQPLNESMSPIRSASLDLNDHEDDTDAGGIHEQLLHLSPAEIAMARRADEGSSMSRAGQPSVPAKRRTCIPVSPGASPRSAPSLKSVTYTPSELAHVQGSDFDGVPGSTDHGTPTRSATAVGTWNQPMLISRAAAPFLIDGMRLAAPLKRLALVRKSDVMSEPPVRGIGADENSVARPLARPPLLTPIAAGPTVTASSVIRSASNVKRPRRVRVLLSDISLNAPSSPSRLSRAPLVVSASSEIDNLECSGAHASCDTASLAYAPR